MPIVGKIMELEKRKIVVTVVMIALAVFVLGAIIYCCTTLKNSKKTITWLAVGDSITWGEGYYRKCYIDFISKNHYEVKADKKGVPGMYTAQLVLYANNGFLDTDYSPDIVTVLMGTNDFGCDVPLSQYMGDLEDLVEIMKTKFPDSRIIFLTPLYRDYFGEKKYILSKKVNNIGYILDDYINMIKAKSKEKGIEVIDLTEDEYFNKDNLKEYTIDGLHPNTKGNIFLADKLYEAIITSEKRET